MRTNWNIKLMRKDLQKKERFMETTGRKFAIFLMVLPSRIFTIIFKRKN